VTRVAHALALLALACVLSFVVATLPGCAALSAYEQQHPDVVRNARILAKAGQCIAEAVDSEPSPLDPVNPYVDAGSPPEPEAK
jgi:hypothetical protein